MVDQILKIIILVLGCLIGVAALRTLFLCFEDRFVLLRTTQSNKHLSADIKEQAKALFARLENGEVKKESLGNEALPDDGKNTCQAYQVMLASPARVEMITTIKEKAYHEEY